MLPLRPQSHFNMVSLQMAKGLDDLKETLNRGKFDGIEKMNHQ